MMYLENYDEATTEYSHTIEVNPKSSTISGGVQAAGAW
jgi:hypothetical protein